MEPGYPVPWLREKNGNKVSQQDITGKTTEYTYNALDLLEKVLDSQFIARYSYNSDGTIKSLRVGDKLTTHYEYDSDKNLTRQWTKMQGDVSREKRERFQIPAMDNEHQTLLADYHYSYDGHGNRIRKDSLTGSTTYAYDSLNRLAKVQYPKGLKEFTYDKADNRIRRLTEKEEELYKYDVCNRLVSKENKALGSTHDISAILILWLDFVLFNVFHTSLTLICLLSQRFDSLKNFSIPFSAFVCVDF